MKIDNSLPSVQTLRPPAANPAKPAVSAAPAGEAVDLSAVASKLQVSDRPPVNNARIQEIKEAISQGRFKINPEAIADGLIETARDLVNSQRKA